MFAARQGTNVDLCEPAERLYHRTDDRRPVVGVHERRFLMPSLLLVKVAYSGRRWGGGAGASGICREVRSAPSFASLNLA